MSVKTQLSGFVRNVKATAVEASPDRILPPWVWDNLKWLLTVVPMSIGLTGDEHDQFLSATLLLLVSIVTSAISLGLTIGLVVFFIGMLVMATIRHFPAVEDEYTTVRSPFRKFWLAFVDLVFGW